MFIFELSADFKVITMKNKNDDKQDFHGEGPHLHDHAGELRRASKKRVKAVFIMTMAFMIVEAIGGWWTNSLALLSDASHMLTDTVALGLALLAFWLSSKPVSPTHNFGFHRAEIIAAFLNGMTLFLLAVLIIKEAYHRLHHPKDVMVEGMLVISVVGLMVNLIGTYILSGGHKENINLKGAFFHVAGDTLGSLGAISAALIIKWTGWLKADPVVSFMIAGIIVVGAVRLVIDSSHIILEGTPKNINLIAVESALLAHPKVSNVHDLHVWTITSGFDSLSAHVVLSEGENDHDNVLAELGDMLMDKFNIAHSTIQLEKEHCQGVCCTTCSERNDDSVKLENS